MKCTIGSNNLKTFARILRFLARISNEIYLESTTEGLTLKVVNSSKTSYGFVELPCVFFTSFRSTGEFEENNCRISVRPMLSIFKSQHSSTSCNLKLDSTNERVLIEFINRKNTKTQHYVSILEHENIDDFVAADQDVNTIICRPRLFSNILTNFPKTIRELNLVISKGKAVLKNHIDHPEKDVETVRLQWGMDSSEFSTYDVNEETSIIIPSQDFISVMELAELYQSNLKMTYTKTGEPFIITVQNESCFLTTIVLATLKENTLKSLRKPKNIQNYKELINSYMGHNKKRKNETAAINTSKSIDILRHDTKSHRLAHVSLGTSFKHRMSNSEVEIMESPNIEATNSMGNNSKLIDLAISNVSIRPSTSRAPKPTENTANLFAFNRKTDASVAKRKSILDESVLDSTNDSALELELVAHQTKETLTKKRKTNEDINVDVLTHHEVEILTQQEKEILTQQEVEILTQQEKEILTQQEVDNYMVGLDQEMEIMDLEDFEKSRLPIQLIASQDVPVINIDQNNLEDEDEDIRIQFSQCTDPEPWKKKLEIEDSEEIFRDVLHNRGNTSIINRIQQSESPKSNQSLQSPFIVSDPISRIERRLIHTANQKAHQLFGNGLKTNPKTPVIAKVLIENSDDEDICSQI